LAIPSEFSSRLTSRVKVLARLETYTRKPQDGVLRRTVQDIDIEARVSVLPANHGERVVLRLVRGGESIRQLADIGFSEQVRTRLESLLDRPQGIVLVSGPVGSGKTTTLYSALEYLHRTRGDTTSLVSLEDPIELQLPFVTQTQMNPKVGMTFAQTLRSALRQDPGALMVGEIRDRESAEIATQAGLTGHLILSTLHVQSASDTFTRLMEMGIEPYILASSCTGALAQRLVRGLCDQCKEPTQVDAQTVARIQELGATLPQSQYFGPVGCPACEGRGFVGRLPIAEMLVVSDGIMNGVRKRSGSDEIFALAKAEGMETLLESGLAVASRGRTSIDEVLRVAG
jgi:general secretion pathway protein E